MISEEQINKAANAAIEKFRPFANEYPDNTNLDAIKCAIVHYKEIIEIWQKLKYEIGLGLYIETKRGTAQAILNNLKERLPKS